MIVIIYFMDEIYNDFTYIDTPIHRISLDQGILAAAENKMADLRHFQIW